MMKKLVFVFCVILLLGLMLTTVGFAAGENDERLENWNIRINVPDNTTAVLEGNEYYIYAQGKGEIPYIMVQTYGYDDANALISDFTSFMKGKYADLKVTADAAGKIIGDKNCVEIDYSYTVSGYEVRDRRIVIVSGGMAYMFTSKEIDALGRTIGSMLDDVVADCVFDDTEKAAEQKVRLAQGYVHNETNGMPKYWLDFTGTVENNLVLHCYFRSDEPAFYERCFILDLSSATVSENGLEIHKVYDQDHHDCSNWFTELTLRFHIDGAVMAVNRDEKTLAGGAEDNIQTGIYYMRPARVGIVSGEKQSYLLPPEDGPYQANELGQWARTYYLRNTGRFLPEAVVAENPDGTFTIHLNEVVDADGEAHKENIALYTVDAYGEGKNDLSGEKVSLMR